MAALTGTGRPLGERESASPESDFPYQRCHRRVGTSAIYWGALLTLLVSSPKENTTTYRFAGALLDLPTAKRPFSSDVIGLVYRTHYCFKKQTEERRKNKEGRGRALIKIPLSVECVSDPPNSSEIGKSESARYG